MTNMQGKAKLTAENGRITLDVDPALFDASGLRVGEEVHVSAVDGGLVLSRIDSERRRKFVEAAEETMELYADAFRRLAE